MLIFRDSLREFNHLKKEDQELVIQVLTPFAYDPGTINEFIMSEKTYNQLKKVDRNFGQNKKKGVKILNKKMLLVEAEEAILSKNKIALLKFDISMLRLVDKAGHADHLLRTLSNVLNTVVKDNHPIKITAARTGGDSFCMIVSSTERIEQKLVDQLYQEVENHFERRITYYQIDQEPLDIRRAHAKSKKEGGQKLIANYENDAYKMLKVFSSGRIPDKADLSGERSINVGSDTLNSIKAKIKGRHIINNEFENLQGAINTFKESHPELKKQIESLEDIMIDKNANLSSYILSFINTYFIDPLLDEEVLQGPDFDRLLHARDKVGNERQVYAYNPWLKNMNTVSGESATDEDIVEIYKQIDQQFGKDAFGKKLPRARKDGSDFIFVNPDHVSKVLKVKIKHIPENVFENDELPIFMTSIDYPDSSTTSENMDNLKRMSQIYFISWLNKQMVEDSNRGKIILDYYLQDRTEDRCKELITIIKTTSSNIEISEEFENMLEDRLNGPNGVNGGNKAKALKELGFEERNSTPLNLKK